jgi:hypothetical protein
MVGDYLPGVGRPASPLPAGMTQILISAASGGTWYLLPADVTKTIPGSALTIWHMGGGASAVI